MKRKPTERNTAVYDFDEDDTEPFITKLANRTKFLQAFSKGTHFSRSGCKDETDDCLDVTARPTQAKCFESSHTKGRSDNQSSSLSDVIESDNSDSESSHRRKALETRFGGSLLSSGTLKDEDLEAGASGGIVMHGEELWLSRGKYSLPELMFTADAIEFKTEDFGVVRLPLSTITNFRSGSDEKDLPFVELDLMENGAQLLQHHSGPLDNCSDALVEKIKQITALSDGYKLIWRPDKEYIKPKTLQSPLQGREGYDDAENEHLLGDCVLQRSGLSLKDWCDLIYPTQDDRDAVTVTKYDYSLLEPGQFLSDTLIDFYIKFLERHIPEADKHRFYFYNSFFFQKLTEASKKFQIENSRLAFDRVKRWTSRINIFDKEYLFIPIMQNAHWSLVIICHPKYLSAGCSDSKNFKAPLILHFDSLEGCHTCIEEPIRSYLIEAWQGKDTHNSEKLATLKFVELKVPQQTNYSDCGLFLLHYVELFIKEVLEKTFLELALEDYPFHEWFNPINASRKRADIQTLIEELRPKKAGEDHPDPECLQDSYAFRSLELAHRPISFESGACDVRNTADDHFGDQSDQACGAICSHQHHHENDMQLSAYSMLGDEHAELESLEVIGEMPDRTPHRDQHCTFNDLDSFSLRQQDASVITVASPLMPCFTHVGHNHPLQSNDCVLLDNGLECDNSDTSLEEVHAPVRQGDERPDQCAAEVADISGKSNGLEETFICASSSPFVSSGMDAQVGAAFCRHYGDVRIFDRPVSPAQKVSMEETSCEQISHAYPRSSSGSLMKKVASPAKVNNVAIVRSTDVRQDSKYDPVGYPVVTLEGLEAVTTVDANSFTLHNTADTNASIQQAVVDLSFEGNNDASCMERSKFQQIAEVTSTNRLEGRIEERKENISGPSSKEDGICVPKVQSTEDKSCPASEMQSDGLHLILNDVELKSMVLNKLGECESLRPSQRKKNSTVGLPARRITRSLAKGKCLGKGI